ncbi:hypothetical protein [Muricoccus aerilatus]|uniref:hypothetical protein n=1 Tax=Muricoccus aerilatus TaxID=452982 RepID=UPI0005C221D2|nr:hypothetical protein [Roseomonas aerilata]
MRSSLPFLLLSVGIALPGCQMDSRQQVLATANTQVAQRAISTRTFDTQDRSAVFRGIIATFQDLGFIVDRADDVLGTISGTQFANGIVRLTVTVRPISGQRVLVRASGQHNLDALTDPVPFQRFFDALSQALFLTANQIE